MALSDLESLKSKYSSEYGTIREAYNTYLGREPDTPGLNVRLGTLPGAGGAWTTSLEQQLSDIANSPEAIAYRQRSESEEGFGEYESMMREAMGLQLEAARMAKEGLVEQAQIAADEAKRAQEAALAFLEQGKREAQAYYKPYQDVGTTGLASLQDLIQKGVQVPSDITKSPYYALYSWQKAQQDKAIQQSLASRGLYDSGPGIQQQITADTGLDAQLAATEYERARQAYLDKMGLSEKMADYGFSATQGAANASIGTGSQASLNAMQTGGLLANSANALGSNLAGVTTQAGQMGANLLNSYGSNVASMMNQGALSRMNLYGDMSKTNTMADLYRAQLSKGTSPSALDWMKGIGSFAAGIGSLI